MSYLTNTPWQMSTAAMDQAHVYPNPNRGMGAVDGKTVGIFIVGATIVGLIGLAIWHSHQTRKEILRREGSSGLLRYDAGTAAIGVGSHLAHAAISGRARRNRRARRRARR